VLAKRGFLPGYAFPPDLVTLETGTTRWSRDQDVELSRDRGIAIAEFAPAVQVIAHKKVFTSNGLYVVSKMDRPTRQWYSECLIASKSARDKRRTNCANPAAFAVGPSPLSSSNPLWSHPPSAFGWTTRKGRHAPRAAPFSGNA